MILIVSKASDQSTIDVIDWCKYFKEPYFLITELLKITEVELFVDKEYAILKFEDNTILDTRTIKGFWYRRQTLYFVLNIENAISNYSIKSHLKDEWRIIVDYLFTLFEQKQCFTDYQRKEVNKLIVLETANRLGIKTPRTIVSSNQLNIIKTIGSKFINKTVHDILSYNQNNVLYMNRTISNENIQFPNSPFFPSLFQPNIDKKYEVRTFFLRNTFSSIAIFSQNDPQTKTDFREYNYIHPNRYAPYTLPGKNKAQLIRLMRKIGLESGSIDFVVDKSDNLIFLEINPVGQFGMVSCINNEPLEMNVCNEMRKRE